MELQWPCQYCLLGTGKIVIVGPGIVKVWKLKGLCMPWPFVFSHCNDGWCSLFMEVRNACNIVSVGGWGG